jgi:ubiquinone biosynthesis protein
VWSFLRSIRYLPRYRRIAAVLARHGLGWLADQAGLSRLSSWPRRLLRHAPPPTAPPSLAQRLCRALAELGPSFVLLGRYLGTRVDLLPNDLCQELTCLPCCGPALPPGEVARVLEAEFGRPVHQVFSELDPVPWRCTWLEQVHRARTPAGREVWVAVPNGAVRARLENDRPLFQGLARLVDERYAARRWSAGTVVQEFWEGLHQEVEARERALNAARWRRHFAGRGQPLFPEVDEERTSTQALTCQALPGRFLVDMAAAPEDERCDLVRALYRFLAQAIFEDGFYPAPLALQGLLVLVDGRLALASLAPAGHLDSNSRQGLLRLLEHFQAEAVGEVIATGVSLGLIERRRCSPVVHQAVRHLLDRYHDLPPAEVRLPELAEDLFTLARRGLIDLPEELALLLRTMVAVENLGRRLAVGVSAVEEMAPVVQEATAAQHSWQSRQERLLRSGRAWLETLQTFPVDASQLLSQAMAGDVQVGVEPRGWQRPMRRVERMVYRLVLSVVTAGLLIAMALLATALLPASGGPWGWILAGLALFSLLVLGGLLLLSFRRKQWRARDEG